MSNDPYDEPCTFVARPLRVEAMRWNGNNFGDIRDFARGRVSLEFARPQDVLFVDALTGARRVEVGDWVVRGAKGQFYPLKPDIFDLTYEAAE